jgi:hypothetical protein
MKNLKTLWASPLAKVVISFVGLFVLLFSLTVVPLMTYFLGDDVPITLYNAYREADQFNDFEYVEVGIQDLTKVPIELLSLDLRNEYESDIDKFYRRLNEGTFYAVIEVTNNTSRVTQVVEEEPDEGLYLEIDYLFLAIDPVRTDEKFEETGNYEPIYDGIQITYKNLISVLDSNVPNMYDRLKTETIVVTLRIYRGQYIIINP